MNKLSYPSQNDLLAQFDSAAFVAAVFTQIEKEFSKIGIAFQLETEELQSYQEFHKRIAIELEVIFRQSRQRLNQLFYSMDLPEDKVNQMLTKEADPLYKLAELILIRVSQKVYFRIHFNPNNSGK